jgi:hypothetical protein
MVPTFEATTKSRFSRRARSVKHYRSRGRLYRWDRPPDSWLETASRRRERESEAEASESGGIALFLAEKVKRRFARDRQSREAVRKERALGEYARP